MMLRIAGPGHHMTERATAKLTETWARAASDTARHQPDYVVQAIRTMQAERPRWQRARRPPGPRTGPRELQSPTTTNVPTGVLSGWRLWPRGRNS